MCEFDNINLERDIKSSYNLDKMFSFLEQRLKLNMIIYNKYLQKMIGVNIQDYKKISGRYKIGEKNGKGREYSLNTNKLIFEGEYINGKRNGKGKDYGKKGKLEFEGEYINGKRNGKGKEYDINGKLEFEGEYINGKRNGKGKEYYKDGKIRFEGEYLKGLKNGKGKEYNYDGKLEFEGEYLNGGKWNGKGKVIIFWAGKILMLQLVELNNLIINF